MRRLYIAGASQEYESISDLMRAAEKRGWTITYDWTKDVSESRACGFADDDFTDEKRRLLAGNDLAGIMTADIVWLVIPPKGRSEGCWFEVGYAYSMGKNVIASGAHHRSIFLALAEMRFNTHDEALAWLGDAI